MRRPLALLFICCVGACRKDAPVNPAEAYGCVLAVGGEDASCTELDPTTTQQERTENAEECSRLAQKTKNHVVGRLVRHCSEAGFTARCQVPGRPANYVSTANPEALKGSRLGCIAGGGTFSVD